MMLDIEPLNKEEKKWLKDFQKLMGKCPSSRFGAYTTGDCDISIYDKVLFDEHRDECGRHDIDDVIIHGQLGTVLDVIFMPFQVDGVAG